MLLFLVAIAASAVASVAGFGIGSLLTPFLATMSGTKLGARQQAAAIQGGGKPPHSSPTC